MKQFEVKTDQALTSSVRRLRQIIYLSSGTLALVILWAFIGPTLFKVVTVAIAMVVFMLLFLALELEIDERKFVSGEQMLALHERAEPFPEVKGELCRILKVRPFLTAREYDRIESRLRKRNGAKSSARSGFGPDYPRDTVFRRTEHLANPIRQILLSVDISGSNQP